MPRLGTALQAAQASKTNPSGGSPGFQWSCERDQFELRSRTGVCWGAVGAEALLAREGDPTLNWDVGCAVWDVGCGIWGVGCGIWNLEFGIWDVIWNLGCGIWNPECGIWNLGSGIWNLESGKAGDSPEGQQGSLPHSQRISQGFIWLLLESVIICCHLLETRMAAAPSDTLQLTAASAPKTPAPRGFTKTKQPI